MISKDSNINKQGQPAAISISHSRNKFLVKAQSMPGPLPPNPTHFEYVVSGPPRGWLSEQDLNCTVDLSFPPAVVHLCLPAVQHITYVLHIKHNHRLNLTLEVACYRGKVKRRRRRRIRSWAQITSLKTPLLVSCAHDQNCEITLCTSRHRVSRTTPVLPLNQPWMQAESCHSQPNAANKATVGNSLLNENPRRTELLNTCSVIMGRSGSRTLT